jgi:hypothetical protein
MTSHGGLYNRPSSTLPTIISGYLDQQNSNNRVSNWTKDPLLLSDSSLIPNFEFGILNSTLHNWRPQAELGVGVNSSFINALQNAGSISSASYSLFWGDEWSDRPCDGSVTFGGYDRSLLEISHSSNVTKKLTRIEPTRCPEGMVVKMTELNLIAEDGTVMSIFDGLSALSACVVPSMRNIMALPKQYGDRIINGVGGKRLDNGTNGYFNGLLTNTVVITPESALVYPCPSNR